MRDTSSLVALERVWPYAVLSLTAAGMLTAAANYVDTMSLLYLNPTESAAAALFALLVALYGSSEGQVRAQQAGDKGTDKNTKNTQQAASNFAVSMDSVLDQMRSSTVDKLNILAEYCNTYYNSSSVVQYQQYQQYQQYLQYLTNQSLPGVDRAVKITSGGEGKLKGKEKKEEKEEEKGRDERGAVSLGGATKGSARHQKLHSAFSDALATTLPSSESIGELFGSRPEGHWKRILERSTETMQYSAYEAPLRKGLNVYCTKTIFKGAAAGDFVKFMTDDAYRKKWDCNSAVWQLEGNHGHAQVGGRSKQHSRLDDIFCKVNIPFFSSRQYFMQRSIWTSANGDGEIICSVRPSSELVASTNAPSASNRGAVTVEDYLSFCAARTKGSSVEVTWVYFEDTRLPSSLVNQIVKRRMEATVQQTESAMRKHMLLRRKKRRNLSCEEETILKQLSMDEGRGEKRKGLLGRVVSVVTVGCLMRTRLLVPVILSELTKQQSR